MLLPGECRMVAFTLRASHTDIFAPKIMNYHFFQVRSISLRKS